MQLGAQRQQGFYHAPCSPLGDRLVRAVSEQCIMSTNLNPRLPAILSAPDDKQL